MSDSSNLSGVQRCACGHEMERDHKETMRGEQFCYLCPDTSRCDWPKQSDEPGEGDRG